MTSQMMPEPMRHSRSPEPVPVRYELVVLTASAGGIHAIRTILAALPANFPVPIAVVQHRTPTAPSILATILGRATALRVKNAEEGDALEARTVYLAPPDGHLGVGADHRLHVSDGRRINFLRSSADPLIRSAAHALSGRVIAVVLTGSGRNGADALRDVRALGGVVIAQDQATSQYWGMPQAAIATGAVNFVLPLDDIAPMLTKLATAAAAREALG